LFGKSFKERVHADKFQLEDASAARREDLLDLQKVLPDEIWTQSLTNTFSTI